MTAIFLRQSVFLLVALSAAKAVPGTALQELAREMHPFLATGTSVWVLACLLAVLVVGHPGLRGR